MPYILERKVAACVRKGEIPIILGGDHSLTFSALKAITAHYGHVTVVHFDAHHDAYPGAALNHYTVFDIVCRKLPVSLVSVGYRYDSDGIPAQLESPITDRVYLSIDVDYFDPKYVPSVGHAVSCPPQKRYDLESFRASLEMIRGRVVGADIVEWCGDSAGEEEVRFVSAAFAELVRVVSNDYN